MRGIAIAALALALALAPGARLLAADEAGLDRLAAARERWSATATGDYEYAYRRHCDCYRDLPPQTVVSVADGQIVSVVHRHEDTATEVPARDGSLELYWTIDGLFDRLVRALNHAAVVRVEYEPQYGYPTAIYIDYDAGLIGDETDLREIRVVLP